MPFDRPMHRVGNELDLRRELESWFSGRDGDTPKQSRFVMRVMRRDSEGSLIDCACRSSITLEPDEEHECPYCLGEGFVWDESFATGYKMPAEAKSRLQSQRVALQAGQLPVFNKIFFMRFDTELSRHDKIIELKLDREGNPFLPYRRNMVHRIESAVEMRSDFGRLEFWTLYVNENKSVRLSKKQNE